MSAARDVFLAHLTASADDERYAIVTEARNSLTRAKLEALDQVEGSTRAGCVW